MLKLCTDYVFPFLANNSDAVLPFAFANGITASGWFLLAEGVLGVNAMVLAFPLLVSYPRAWLVYFSGSGHPFSSVNNFPLCSIPQSNLRRLRSFNWYSSHDPEVFFGPRVFPLLSGLAIGAMTALTAPLLWPSCFELLCSGDTYIVLNR